MEIQDAIPLLDNEWDRTSGFLGRLRQGFFDPEGLARLINTLQSVDLRDTTCLDRRFVALIWFIPLFMSWQVERVAEEGGDVHQLNVGMNKVFDAVTHILGVL